jgi:hypothetical protein
LVVVEVGEELVQGSVAGSDDRVRALTAEVRDG